MKAAVPEMLTALAVPPSVAESSRFCLPLASVMMVAFTPAEALLMASRTPARVFWLVSRVMSTAVPPLVRVRVRLVSVPKSSTAAPASYVLPRARRWLVARAPTSIE
jgi:hypothetical protein